MGWWFLYEALIRANQAVVHYHNETVADDPLIGVAILLSIPLCFVIKFIMGKILKDR